MPRILRSKTWRSADEIQKRIFAWYLANVKNAHGGAWAHPMYDRLGRQWAIVLAADVEHALTDLEKSQIVEVSREEYRSWETHENEPPDQEPRTNLVTSIISEFSRRLVEAVAENPTLLDHVEWRDLERMMAEVCDGLGFDVELTPSAKDGGKDIILHLRNIHPPQTYFVEIKHWRSGKKVGTAQINAFIEVVARDHVTGGLMLSTSGFGEIQVESHTRLETAKLRFGNGAKVVSLCETFVRSKNGLWQKPATLTEVLFDGTKQFTEIDRQ